ncbi:MAG: hypothetical protein FWC71_01310 [Defluviitaleaceae bacterium]|nr:hypothetical protein [Defluviitaleaceae bacterium]
MKKRCIVSLLIIWACIFVLAGCNNEDAQYPDPAPNPTQPPTDANITAETPPPNGTDPIIETTPDDEIFYFVVRGNTIHLDEDINDVLARLGEPLSTFDVPSCAFDGMDRFFLFPGVQIQSYPVDDMDRVHTILLTDDSLTTVGGIFIGSSLASVLATYGYDYDYSYGLYIFVRGNTTLRFLMNDMMVQTISYELIV